MAILRAVPEYKGTFGVFSSGIHLEIDGCAAGCIGYEYKGDILPVGPSDNGWALLAILPYAMRHGFDVHVEGRVERLLLERLEEYQRAWVRWGRDKYRAVAITADEEFVASPKSGQDAVLAFSGGVDSVFSLHAHTRGLVGRQARKIKAGVFLDLVKGEDFVTGGADARKLGDLSKIAASYGVPLTVVKTNIRDFHNKVWSYFHIPSISSAMMQYDGCVDCAIVSSDIAYEKEILGWGNNSITNQLVSACAFPIIITGAGWGRTEKVRVLKDNKEFLNHLNVCYRNKGSDSRNCGVCNKCIRTKLNFVASGQLYVPAFDGGISVECVENLYGNSDVSRIFLEDLLENGDWTHHASLKKAVESVVRASKDRSLWGRTVRAVRKLTRRIAASSR